MVNYSTLQHLQRFSEIIRNYYVEKYYTLLKIIWIPNYTLLKHGLILEVCNNFKFFCLLTNDFLAHKSLIFYPHWKFEYEWQPCWNTCVMDVSTLQFMTMSFLWIGIHSVMLATVSLWMSYKFWIFYCLLTFRILIPDWGIYLLSSEVH